jgi:hypothetical protein
VAFARPGSVKPCLQNGSTSSHRWRTLHAYLNEQAYLLDMEQAARHADKKRQSSQPGTPIKSLSAPLSGIFRPSSRSSGTFASGVVVEPIVSANEQDTSRSRSKKRSVDVDTPLPITSAHVYGMSPVANSSGWSLQLPKLNTTREQERRFSNPGMRSAELLSARGARSPSTGRASVLSDRPKSASFWANVSRRSGMFGSSQASLLPSGSMLDMHLGMDMDREKALMARGPNSPALSLAPGMDGNSMATVSTKKKKKGLRKLLSKLFESASAPVSPSENDARFKHGSQYNWQQEEAVDDSPLEPPYPSYFFDTSRRHDRSASTSSQSSTPHSPKDGHPISPQLPSSYLRRDSPKVDPPGHAPSFTLQPLRLVTSQDSASPPSTFSSPKPATSDMAMRTEKSLPALPMGDASDEEDPSQEEASYAVFRPSADYPYHPPASPGLESMFGGGTPSKAKVKSRFGGLGDAFKRPMRLSTHGPAPVLARTPPVEPAANG